MGLRPPGGEPVNRKLCRQCGQPSLETETRCWACGSMAFAAVARPGAPAVAPGVGEQTVACLAAGEATLGWEDTGGTGPPRWAWPAALVVLTAAACAGGYLLGSMVPGNRAQPPSPAAAPAVVRLPSPPRAEPLPEVTVRPLPPPAPLPVPGPAGGAAPSAPAAEPAPAPAPETGVAAGPRAAEPPPGPVFAGPGTAEPGYPAGSPAPEAPRIRVSVPPPNPRRAPARAVAPLPAEDAPLPAPGREAAVVALRNDSGAPVEVSVEGNGTRTATIPPGGIVPLRLEPGSYQVRAAGGGASSAQSTLAVARGRTYSLLISRQREGGREHLVLIEPLEPGLGE